MKKPSIVLITSCLLILLVAIPLLGQKESGRQVDWGKLNPGFKGANLVGDKEACVACHEESSKKYLNTTHGRLFSKGMKEADCETCHGPRSKHMEEPDSSLKLSVEQYSQVCMQCHQDGNRMYWRTSLHKTTGVGCVSCHAVMENRSPARLLSKANQFAVCSTCHEDVKAMLSRTSHHPIQEGKVDCSSCHNPHGASGAAMLAKGEVNETCFDCHQEKRGPFLWEHPPAIEDCLTCHQPHGSNNRSLLVTQNASLCTSCHQYGGHVNEYRYNRVSTPYGNGCVNCHMAVHGSNHPSGARFTR